jgi:hypothetical protein
MERIFGVVCPVCKRAFVVAWELRNADIKLRCSGCQAEFLPEEAHSLDERTS